LDWSDASCRQSSHAYGPLGPRKVMVHVIGWHDPVTRDPEHNRWILAVVLAFSAGLIVQGLLGLISLHVADPASTALQQAARSPLGALCLLLVLLAWGLRPLQRRATSAPSRRADGVHLPERQGPRPALATGALLAGRAPHRAAQSPAHSTSAPAPPADLRAGLLLAARLPRAEAAKSQRGEQLLGDLGICWLSDGGRQQAIEYRRVL